MAVPSATASQMLQVIRPAGAASACKVEVARNMSWRKQVYMYMQCVCMCRCMCICRCMCMRMCEIICIAIHSTNIRMHLHMFRHECMSMPIAAPMSMPMSANSRTDMSIHVSHIYIYIKSCTQLDLGPNLCARLFVACASEDGIALGGSIFFQASALERARWNRRRFRFGVGANLGVGPQATGGTTSFSVCCSSRRRFVNGHLARQHEIADCWRGRL